MTNWSYLQQTGFTYLDICSLVQISKLKALYITSQSEKKWNGMNVSHNLGSSISAKEVSQQIHQILASSISSLFPDYDYFIGHFAVKGKHTFHNFDLHRDWNLVDEAVKNSIQVWIPLSISYPENGGMCFIPRSHLFNNFPRSGSLGIPIIKIDPDIYPYLSFVRLLLGQAVCFYNSTFHGSFSNPTEEDRISVLINLVPKGVEAEYIHWNNRDKKLQTYLMSANELLENLPELEKGVCPTTELKSETAAPSGLKKQDIISKEELLIWIKKDRGDLNLPVDYEFRQRSVLKNDELAKEINIKGYTTIQLLTEVEIEKLKQVFSTFFPNKEQYIGGFNSMVKLSTQERIEIHQLISGIIQDRLGLFFRDYQCPISTLWGKQNDGVDNVDIHADPSFTFNPKLEDSFIAWCPLLDVDERHGTLKVAPKSHRLINHLRNNNYAWPLENRHILFGKYLKPLTLKAGEAVLFDDRLVHASSPNLSDKVRECVVFRIVHKSTNFISVSPSKNKDVMEIYKQNADYFFDSSVVHYEKQPSVGVYMGNMAVFPQKISDEAIERMLNPRSYV